jgi:hypothetical protein
LIIAIGSQNEPSYLISGFGVENVTGIFRATGQCPALVLLGRWLLYDLVLLTGRNLEFWQKLLPSGHPFAIIAQPRLGQVADVGTGS